LLGPFSLGVLGNENGAPKRNSHASGIFFGMRYSGILRERGLHHLRIGLRHDVQGGCWGRNITCH
jgi:hypothetical protein